MKTLTVTLCLLAGTASAGPYTGCVTSLADFTFRGTPGLHYQVGAWEQTAGCNPSGPDARPTGGMYTVSFDGDTVVVDVDAEGFNPFCSTQLDIKGINEFGIIVEHHDVIVNPFSAGACSRPVPAPMLALFVETGGNPPNKPQGGDNPPDPCLGCGIDQRSTLPVPEPGTWLLLATSGLVGYWRMRR